MVNKLRGTEKNIILLDCGDFVSDDRGKVQEITAEVTMKGMNGMMYDAVILGPRELSLGPVRLKAILANAVFPTVTTNLVSGETGRLFGTGHVIVERNGMRVGFIGVMPEGEVKAALPSYQERGLFRVLPVEEAVAKAVGEIRDKVDVLVLVSHESYALTCKLVDKVSGIDLAISASDERETPAGPAPPKPVLRAAYRGTSLGYATFEMRKGKAVLRERKKVDLDCSAPDIPEDPAVAALIGPDFEEKVGELARKRAASEEAQVLKEAKELWKLSPREYLEQEMKKEGGKNAAMPADNPFLKKKE
jgi:5'-nucleotidase